jgi:muramidase (phage lysozyme)
MSQSRTEVKELIARHESGGDYNVVYGGKSVPLTDMTIGEVIEWQRAQKAVGAESTAVGKYQIILPTLEDLARRNPKDFGEERKFNEAAQEWAADTLLDRRGFKKFEAGELDLTSMARELAKEWASLPDPETGKSYYDGDGLNKSHHDVNNVLATLQGVQEKGKKAQTAKTFVDAIE